MEFKQIVRVCYDFSVANGGTIQSYPAGSPDKLEVHSRTTRMEILVERDPVGSGHWLLKLLQDASGGKTSVIATVSSEGHLHAQLLSFWDDKDELDLPR